MRKSIDSRMGRIMDALLPPSSMARREYELSDAQRVALLCHRQAVADKFSTAETEQGVSSFEGVLDGTLETPPMPADLRKALGLTDPPAITDDMTSTDASAVWAKYALGEHR